MSGGLSEARVERALKSRDDALFRCFLASMAPEHRPDGVEFKGFPGDGTVRMSVEVALSGRVTDVELLSSDFQRPELEACLRGALRGTTFPSVNGRKRTTLRLALDFREEPARFMLADGGMRDAGLLDTVTGGVQ